jgi:REP element-mobilizing transposase RayT
MELNAAGVIVENQLMWLQDRYEYVKIHLAVVMPDHVHAIIEIRSNGKNGIKVKSLSELMGAFKMTSSKQIRAEEFPSFAWQRSFHDRIIRNEESYDAILRYIKENPMNWENK